MKRAKVTLAEIAQACGVSVSTASRALRGDTQISAETRQRVVAEARRLNYTITPSTYAGAAASSVTTVAPGLVPGLARGLAPGATLAVIEHANNIRGFFFEALMAIEHAAGQYGLNTVFVAAGTKESLKDCLAKATAVSPAAIILFTWTDLIEADAALINSVGIPVIIFNRHISGLSNAVTLDEYAAGVRIARYLYARGHRRIAHLRGPNTSSSVRERTDGIRAELMRLNCYDPELFGRVDCLHFVDSVNDSVRKFLSMPEPPTAIWAYNDMAAAVAYTAVRTAGLAVPGDISIAGFDYQSQVRDLNLTTFDHRHTEMGRIAVNMAVNLCTGVYTGPLRFCVVPALVEGATTGPAPAGRLLGSSLLEGGDDDQEECAALV